MGLSDNMAHGNNTAINQLVGDDPDSISAAEIKERADMGRQNMDLSGASDEPTFFDYFHIIGFYKSAREAIEAAVAHEKHNPEFVKTADERKSQITKHLTEIVEFQSAWTVLKMIGFQITAEDFKEYSASKRKELYLDALQEHAEKFSELISAREDALSSCRKCNMLPKNYF